MALDFPSNPTNNQIFSSGLRTWTFQTSSNSWISTTTTVSGATGLPGATGAGATGATGFTGATGLTGATGATGLIGATGSASPKSITLYSPSLSENVTFFYSASNIIISSIYSVVTGTTPSVTFSLQNGANRASATITNVSSQAVTSTTTGNSVTVANANITAGSWVWLTTSATSGTVNSFSVTLTF